MQKIIGYYIDLLTSSYSPPTWASTIAGAFVLLTLTLSFYLILEHLSTYKNPEVCTDFVCVCVNIKFLLFFKLLLANYFYFYVLNLLTGAEVFDLCYINGAMLCS